MSYDPSHRMPPRQERWPHATPAGGWPSYRDPEEEQADRLDASPATAGYRGQASSQHASGGSSDRGHQSAVATAAFPLAGTGYNASGGYGPADYGPAGYGDGREGYDRTPDGNGGADNGYGWGGNGNGYRTGGYVSGGYPGGINGYGGTANGYAGASDGYADAADDFAGPPGGYDSTSNGYAGNGHSYGSASHRPLRPGARGLPHRSTGSRRERPGRCGSS